MKNNQNKDVIVSDVYPPLTKRGYLTYKALDEVCRTYNCNAGESSLANLATILHLYGAECKGFFHLI